MIFMAKLYGKWGLTPFMRGDSAIGKLRHDMGSDPFGASISESAA
jgi:hypothetical protein